MINKNKKVRNANSLLPLGAAILLLILVGLSIWFTQDLHLSKPTTVDPLQAEQEKINSLLHKINSDIEKAQQLQAKKANTQVDN